MKLTQIRALGRYINPETGRAVTVLKGRKVGYGVDILFYLFRYSRVFINDSDFYSKWKKV